MRRSRWTRLILVTLFIGVPLVEIFVLIQVGQVIGPWWTILLLVVDSIFGAWLIRREGGKAWRALTTALETGRMPARELADGALILVGGTLMLTPGFVTDAVRHPADPAVHPSGGAPAADPGDQPTAAPARLHRKCDVAPDPDPSGSVVQGEVVED